MKAQSDSTLTAVEPPATFVERRAQDSRAVRANFGFRKLWLKIHRRLGLTAGVLFVLLGLTGSLLVFDHAIDEWLNPKLLLTSGAGDRRSIEEIVTAAEKAFAGPSPHAISVTSPRVANGVWTVWFSSGTEEAPKFTAVHVDPYTTHVTGQRVWGEDLMSWIYRLHFRLLAGETGATVVGLTGILMMISIGSGISLWWPLWKNGRRAAFVVRTGSLLTYDLHKIVGITSAGLLLVIAFTGTYMEFPDWFKPVVTVFSEETQPPEEQKSEASQARQAITADQAVAIAEAQFPHASFCHFHPPEEPHGMYEVALLQPGEVQQSFGRTQVFIDQYSGSILAVRNPDDFTAADAFFAWQFPLHNGEAFGLVGRWIVFFAGLTPAVLYVTGFLLWRRRQKSRRQQQRRTKALDRTEAPASAFR